MSRKVSRCPHVVSIGLNRWEDINRKARSQELCISCGARGPNLWLCLYSQCLYVGCGESSGDHSSEHAENTKHCLTLNMTTMRIWCYTCETEVFKDGNDPPLIMDTVHSLPSSGQSTPQRQSSIHSSPTATPDDSDSDDEDENHKPRGLTGLQNIGNTCYMNAAIQSLSNCPPLTRFFLDCPGFVRTEKKPMLSKSYNKLVAELWHKKRPSYVVPSSVAHGIKIVHPMFKGYTQQDTQEFLRCFMDQLHEELKQPVPKDLCSNDDDDDDNDTLHESPDTIVEPETPRLAESDADYETCDSGTNSERSSVENANISGDEIIANPDNCEEILPRSKTGGPGYAARTNKNCQDDDSGVSMTSANSVSNMQSKEYKDTLNKNMANRQISDTSDREDKSENQDSPVIEYSDAVAELEPLQGQRIRTRSRHVSDTEQPMLQSHTQPISSSQVKANIKKKKVPTATLR